MDQAGIAIIVFLALFLIGFLSVYIFFLITQQNALKAIQPENRLMRPGEVWLQLIPLFGIVWQFIVVTRIADSMRNEFESWQNDTILGLPDAEAVQVLNLRPTYDIGIATCILSCCGIIPYLQTFVGIAWLICFIIYWNRLAEYKRKIERRTMY